MKQRIIQFLRTRRFQGTWETLYRISKIGMNYWGGASLCYSGEIHVLHYIKKKLNETESIILFDVGANDGDYALLAYDIFKNKLKIYSFEPSEYTFKILVENTKGIDSINSYNIGFGEKIGKVKLYSSGKGSTLASVYNLSNRSSTFKEEYSEEIKIETIDSFCNKNNLESIDILKIDIEGHELYALKGAKDLIKNKKIRFIQFEFGECHIDSKTFFKDFINFFNEEYTFYRIVSDGLRKIESYSSNLEIFGTANFLVELNSSLYKK